MMSERRYSAVLAKIYEAGCDYARWPEALDAVAKAHDAPTAVLMAVGPDGKLALLTAPGVDPGQHERYAVYYHRINPIWRLALPGAPGEVLTDQMMIEKREFERTEFFNDFLTPLGLGSMLGAALFSEGGHYSAIGLQRKRSFDEPSVALYRRFAPHLARAFQLNVRLAAIERRALASAEILDRLPQGAILVDAESRVLFANREAERLVSPCGRLRIEGGVLCARSAAETATLRALIARCGGPLDGDAGGALALPCDDGAPPMSALVLPLRSETPSFLLSPRPVAIVFVTDPGRVPTNFDAQLRRRFGLTPSESAVAREIAKGDGLQATADRLRISLATARTHLAHIFDKTGARRQAELVRMFASISSDPA